MTELIIKPKRFWTFNQNNSGGSFVVNLSEGTGHYVVVEAESVADVNKRAEKIGLYWDYSGNGDCGCCGERWRNQWDEESDPEPMIHGEALRDYKFWHDSVIFVHYLDGKVERYDAKKSTGRSEPGFVFFGTEKEGRTDALRRLRGLVALAKDQAGKAEGITARDLAIKLAQKHGIAFEG